VNCNTDLSWFAGIVPCGLPDHGVTSLTELAGREVTVDELRPAVERALSTTFGLELRPMAVEGFGSSSDEPQPGLPTLAEAHPAGSIPR
jgi:lipoate-protein ligase B